MSKLIVMLSLKAAKSELIKKSEVMQKTFDPFEAAVVEIEVDDDFKKLTRKSASVPSAIADLQLGVMVAKFVGFDLQDQPLITNLACLPGQIVTARSTVALQSKMINSDVVVMFDGGNIELPIILGVIQDQKNQDHQAVVSSDKIAHAQIDNERIEIAAEREIVLRCGDASITLTRAGKVIIKGNYIISRSAGYNKIKGAAIELN